jgi:hypothetical protein
VRGVISCVGAAVSEDGCWRRDDSGVGDLLSFRSAVCSILCAAAGGFTGFLGDAFKAIWTLTRRKSC